MSNSWRDYNSFKSSSSKSESSSSSSDSSSESSSSEIKKLPYVGMNLFEFQRDDFGLLNLKLSRIKHRECAIILNPEFLSTPCVVKRVKEIGFRIECNNTRVRRVAPMSLKGKLWNLCTENVAEWSAVPHLLSGQNHFIVEFNREHFAKATHIKIVVYFKLKKNYLTQLLSSKHYKQVEFPPHYIIFNK